MVSSIMSILSEIQATVGFATLDQLQYGGDEGFKSLLIGGAITASAGIVIKVLGKIFRKAFDLVKVASGKVIRNGLLPKEAAFAEKIVESRGGTFVGGFDNQIALDGYLDGVGVQLKQITGKPGKIFKGIEEAATKAVKNERYSHGVKVFIEADQYTVQEVLSELAEHSYSQKSLKEAIDSGAIGEISVLTKQGWITIDI